MREFTALFTALDQTNSTNEKVAEMAAYFGRAPAADAAWAVYFLSGRRLKRLIKRAELAQWVLEETGYPEWLLRETYHGVGDMAETIALLLAEPVTAASDDMPLAEWVETRILALPTLGEAERAATVRGWWRALPPDARFVLNKLLTGAFRVGVSQRLVVRALAQHFSLETAILAHRLMGDWYPTAEWFAGLRDDLPVSATPSLPYPFFLASPLETEADTLGATGEWQAEWKWDGIRAQLIRRSGATFVWTRGEDRVEARFPEIVQAASALPDGTVLDGEVLAWSEAGVMPFAVLQKRIGRLRPGPKMLAEAPLAFMAYDLLEWRGEDWRERELAERRDQLQQVVAAHAPALKVSEAVRFEDWAALARWRSESRARGVEGLMLKRLASAYQVGRRRGDWWKWKIDPYTVDAVLIYAQPGSGRRSNLLTDYTFAVWQGEPGASALVPVCKAYSGLTNEEIRTLDRWIRRHTEERFGPVRSVTPTHVFEIAFEGISASKRHKSGVAMRFPRMSRWRTDLGIQDADSLAFLNALLSGA